MNAKVETMALPLGKTRILPDWMVGAANRVGFGTQKPVKSKPVTANKQTKQKTTPVKATPKPKRK